MSQAVVGNHETVVGPDRKRLGFATIAPESFGFLRELGFRLVEVNDTLVSYESERRLVRVFHGRGSYELGVEVGRWIEVDGVKREQAFPLRDVVSLTHDLAEVGVGGTSATSVASVRKFLGQLAGWTREFALPLLTNGDDLFDRLSEVNAARSEAYLEDIRASRLRTRADAAWRSRDLDAVVLAYTEIERELGTVSLRASERARLEYATKHGAHRSPLIEGDYYEGAFGPTILIVLTARESIGWLRTLFDHLASAPVGEAINLVDQPQVQIGAALAELSLSRIDHRPAKHLVGGPHGRFAWRCTSDEWGSLSLTLEGLYDRAGHQYLTSEAEDDALIEVSFGEHHA